MAVVVFHVQLRGKEGCMLSFPAWVLLWKPASMGREILEIKSAKLLSLTSPFLYFYLFVFWLLLSPFCPLSVLYKIPGFLLNLWSTIIFITIYCWNVTVFIIQSHKIIKRSAKVLPWGQPSRLIDIFLAFRWDCIQHFFQLIYLWIIIGCFLVLLSFPSTLIVQ